MNERAHNLGRGEGPVVFRKVDVEVFDPHKDSWDDVGTRVLRIAHEAFEDFHLSDEEVKADFENPNNIVVLLKKKDDLIGFSYAEPIKQIDPKRKDSKYFPTAYVSLTAIKPEHQSKGYLKTLSPKLEDLMRDKGYFFMEIHAMIENGYADKLEAFYADRVIDRADEVGERTGKRIRFLQIIL